MINLEKVMRLSPGSNITRLDDIFVVFPPPSIESDTPYVCTVNETAHDALLLLDGSRSMASIVSVLYEIYDVEYELLRKEMAELFSTLETIGIICERQENGK